jgi:hypothetical protein
MLQVSEQRSAPRSLFDINRSLFDRTLYSKMHAGDAAGFGTKGVLLGFF